jgi:hypothetical protein
VKLTNAKTALTQRRKGRGETQRKAKKRQGLKDFDFLCASRFSLRLCVKVFEVGF